MMSPHTIRDGTIEKPGNPGTLHPEAGLRTPGPGIPGTAAGGHPRDDRRDDRRMTGA